ncbi:MAG: NYN domain-containing protein [Rhodomicrobium sp.]
MITIVYVDGFNLYYRALKGTPYKWLDILALSKQLIPVNHVVDKVKYFTARVSGAKDPTSPQRQQIYLSALKTFHDIEIHYGSFLSKSMWRPIITLPVAGETISSAICAPTIIPQGVHDVTGTRGQQLVVGSYPVPGQRAPRARRAIPDAVLAEVHAMEEKGSDVNLAAHLLNDAWKNAFDAAVVISNDTDLIEPIRMVTTERNKVVFVACPGNHAMAPKLANVATYQRHIRPAMLASSQLLSPIPSTTIRKPATW